MKPTRAACILCVFVLGLSNVEASASQKDNTLIREVQAQQAVAWNAHDATAYAALFSEDADVVNVLGWLWQGRLEIQSKLTDAFAWVFRDSKLVITDVQIRFIDKSTAVSHVRWTLDGAKAPPGTPVPPREGIEIQVLQKVGNQWLITRESLHRYPKMTDTVCSTQQRWS